MFWRAVKSKLARGSRSIVWLLYQRAERASARLVYEVASSVPGDVVSLATKQKVGSHLAWLGRRMCVCGLYTATHCSPPPDCPTVHPPPPHPPLSSTNPTNILHAFMYSRFGPKALIFTGKVKNKKEASERKREEEGAAIHVKR